MAERGGGGKASLAGINLSPVFRGEAVEFEHLDRDVAFRFERRPRDLDEAPGLRHFAGACVLASGGAANEQKAARTVRGVAPHPRFINRIAGGDPVEGKIVVGIGVPFAGLSGARALAAVPIGVPGRVGEFPALGAEFLEGGIDELEIIAGAELRLIQLGIGHSLARGDRVLAKNRHAGVPRALALTRSAKS
jgi:hypothetical protein